MTKKRDLMAAVDDRLVKKQPSQKVEAKPGRNNHTLAKILVSLILGFAGGLTVSRWIKFV
jgi:hypothetical protein